MEKHPRGLRFFPGTGWELLVCDTPVTERLIPFSVAQGLEQGMVSGLVCAPGDGP